MPSFGDARAPLYNGNWLASWNAPDQPDVSSQVNGIVNGRGPGYSYQIGAKAGSSGGYADVAAPLNFTDNAPVPAPAAVWVPGSGLVGLIGLRRRFTK